MRVALAVGCAWLAAGALSGCVNRKILVQSEPPGAAVRINGQSVGQTPLEQEFITHGRYAVTLTKPGFQELTAREWIKAPWHQWMPLDFVTELLIPHTFQDVHVLRYQLQPATPAQRIKAERRPDFQTLSAVLRGSSHPSRRRSVCVQMARHAMREGIPVLSEATHDPSAEVRAEALHALRVLAGREAFPEVVHRLQHDDDPMVRWQATTELEALRAPEGIPPLLAALEDRDAMVRASVVEALRALRDKGTAAAVAARLRDRDIVVRRSAADALGLLGESAAAEPLTRSLRDPDDDVRVRSAKSLLALRVPGTAPAMARALRDRSPKVRATAIEGLAQFGTPAAVPITIQQLRSWRPATREAAATALGVLNDPAGVPPLERAVRREPNPGSALAMANALVTLGAWQSSAVPPYEARAEAARQAAEEQARRDALRLKRVW